MINANQPQLWKQDVLNSVDLYNNWFVNFAPEAYKHTRHEATKKVEKGIEILENLFTITPKKIMENPEIVSVLRMCTSPPIARDRLTGLAYANQSIVKTLEKGKLPKKMNDEVLEDNLKKICDVIYNMLDRDIFSWLSEDKQPTEAERFRASTIVADRLCGSVANPTIRNAQEKRQLNVIEQYLIAKGYEKLKERPDKPTNMEKGTYRLEMNVPYINGDKKVNIPMDVAIQKKTAKKGELPILIECKSAGDFANTNKRRKEEATKMHQLQSTYGKNVKFILFLCGYFGTPYLGYEAAEGIDWIWEHRIEDMEKLGL